MGVYGQYLDQHLDVQELHHKRKEYLKKISNLRERDTIVLTADLTKRAPISIDYSDLIPFRDQLDNVKGDKVDLILETPGGSGEYAEEIVLLLRNKFKEVGIIIPGRP